MTDLNIVIYDLEIIRAIPPRKGEPRLPDISYCEGWRDFDNMGISVAGAYDYLEDRYRVFCEDNFDELQKLLNRADVIVDFNGTQFDAPLLKANELYLSKEARHYDILREIWKAEGHNPDVFDPKTHTNYGLDACCETNFQIRKSGNGAMAPIDWQRGNIGNVIDYCLNDIRLTKELFDKIRLDGWIINPKDPEQHIELPFEYY